MSAVKDDHQISNGMPLKALIQPESKYTRSSSSVQPFRMAARMAIGRLSSAQMSAWLPTRSPMAPDVESRSPFFDY